MNLWKLWIARHCWLSRIGSGRVSMNEWTRPRSRKSISPIVPSTFDESVVLLDVREDDEWQRGHAPGARHIPMGQIPARIDEIDPAAKLYVVCQGGGRSQRVSQYLAQNGYAPVNVSGGMLAWAGAGRPVVTDDGGVGVV